MRALVVVLPACVAPAALVAQATTASVHGYVRDDATVIAGARVEATSRETGAVRSATTDADGGYRLLALSPGSYDLTARALGHRPQRLSGVDLVLGGSSRLDFILVRGPVELEPTLVVAPARTDFERMDASTVIVERQIDELPLNARDVLGLAAIAPGIRSFAQNDGRSIPAAGAATAARFVNLYVDGVEWKGFATGALVGQPQAGSLLPMEAVREYRVLLNPYDAEYTRGASWVMSALTHQGSNRVEGSLFAYHQNQQLVARGHFSQGNAEYRRTQFGGNVRGPIVHGRLFYSLSYEGQRTDDVIDVVPGSSPDAPGIWDRYAGSFAAPIDNETGMLRLTALAAAHTIDASWITRRLTSIGSFGLPQNGTVFSREAGARSSYRVDNVQLHDRWVRRHALNELALSLLQNDIDDEPLQSGVAFHYPGIQTGRPATPSTTTGQQLGIIDKLLIPLRGPGGSHLLKLGVELTRVTGNGYTPNSRAGFFRYDSDTASNPSSGQIGIGYLHPGTDEDARTSIDGWMVGAFLQDQWQPARSLTVVIGARYDAEPNTLGQRQAAPWASDTVLRRLVGGWYLNDGDRQNDLDNIAPRVALSWDVAGRGRTSIRAGYGVMYDRVPVSGAFSEKQSWTWRVYRIPNPGTTDPDSLRRLVLAARSRSAPALTLLPDRMETPSNRQWSLGMSHRLAEHVVIAGDYLDQHMRNLPVTVLANTVDRTTGRRPLTNAYGDIQLWGSFGDATYRALLTSLSYDERSSLWTLAYTLAHARSEFAALSTSDFVDSSLYRMQRSDGDERHRIVLSGIAAAPFGMHLSGVAIAASPRPFIAYVGTDTVRPGTHYDDWPNGLRTWRRNGWAYWYRTIDLRAAKSFALARGEMIVSADVFNVIGWANHAAYRPSQRQLGFAEPVADYAGRQGQLGVRYRF